MYLCQIHVNISTGVAQVWWYQNVCTFPGSPAVAGDPEALLIRTEE